MMGRRFRPRIELAFLVSMSDIHHIYILAEPFTIQSGLTQFFDLGLTVETTTS